MNFDVNQLFVKICGSDGFFAFEGEISSERINVVLENIEKKLTEIHIDLKVQKKIYNIMVECLQNLYHHSDEVPENLTEKLGKSYGMIVIKRQRHDNSFALIVGNFILMDKVKFLSEKIDKLNSLSTEELKEMYKFILNYQKLSTKGGGGLGLIDIARKSERKLAYRFYPYNKTYCFYRLDIIV
ncbi:MAG: SiaB family protein kinase [Bacteroidales bacterium]|jgi:hypothetical protein|nr:SiaB family protein kinase [Bacteroidales bacterium]